MTGSEIYGWAVWAQLLFAGCTFLGLFFVTAPYGRHTRSGWGPTLPQNICWALMELPAVGVFIFVFVAGKNRFDLISLFLLGIWQIHYLNRAFIFPFRIRSTPTRQMPLVIPLLGIVFNTLNAYTNALWIGSLGIYTMDWIIDPRFLLGIALFFGGWIGNLHSDAILRNLRRKNKIGYKIPNGNLFRWVSSPNYLCEIIEWAGWAIATWSTAGLAFSIFTTANLVPRAISHHNWYRKNFKTYPTKRKAIIPYLL